MNRTVIAGLTLALAGVAGATAASAEDIVIKGPISDVFGHRVVVQSDAKKFLVNLGPKIDELAAVKSGDTIAVEGDLTKSGEVRAYNVTLADGKKLEVSKDKKTWRQWLLGEDSTKRQVFTVADAKKLAADKGYTLLGEPAAKKKHFTAKATKDGKSFDIALHRDGTIKEAVGFNVADAKKLATDKGYTLQGEPVAKKKHFTAKATKDGKTFDLDLHRNGTVKEAAVFGPTEAKANITGQGFELIGDVVGVKKHYEALGKKGSDFYELHAMRDGAVKQARKVDKSDPKWGSKIQ